MIVLNYHKKLENKKVGNDYSRSRSSTQPNTVPCHDSILSMDSRARSDLMTLQCYKNNYWYVINSKVKSCISTDFL